MWAAEPLRLQFGRGGPCLPKRLSFCCDHVESRRNRPDFTQNGFPDLMISHALLMLRASQRLGSQLLGTPSHEAPHLTTTPLTSHLPTHMHPLSVIHTAGSTHLSPVLCGLVHWKVSGPPVAIMVIPAPAQSPRGLPECESCEAKQGQSQRGWGMAGRWSLVTLPWISPLPPQTICSGAPLTHPEVQHTFLFLKFLLSP